MADLFVVTVMGLILAGDVWLGVVLVGRIIQSTRQPRR